MDLDCEQLFLGNILTKRGIENFPTPRCSVGEIQGFNFLDRVHQRMDLVGRLLSVLVLLTSLDSCTGSILVGAGHDAVFLFV